MTTADQTAAADQTARAAPIGPASHTDARPGVAYWVQEAVGLIPPLSAIGIAATFQTQTMHDVFGWWWPFAALPAACIEGGVAYFGFLYERHLVAGDSTLANRVWMLICAAISCATIYWHVTEQLKKPWQMAAVVGGMAALSLALWMRRSKWKRRELLRDRGLLDAQAPRFSLARWVLCPVETPRAFRHAIKYGLSDPIAALADYRAKQTTVAQTSAPTRTETMPTVEPAPKQTAKPRPPRAPKQTPPPKPDQTDLIAIRSADAQILQTIRGAHPTGLPTLGAIKAAITAIGQTCGQTKAIRLRGLLADADQSDAESADPEPAAAAAN